MSFYAKFWGVRGSIPTPGHRTRVYGGNTSCVEFRINDQLFICDAGTGLRELSDSLRWRDNVPSEFNMFFSHSHWTTFKAFHFLRQLILQERLSMFTEYSRSSIKLTHCSRGR